MTLIETPTNGSRPSTVKRKGKGTRPGGAGECSFCGEYFVNKKLHETQAHGSGQTLVDCEVCHQPVKQISLGRHMGKHKRQGVKPKAKPTPTIKSNVAVEEEVIAVLALLLPTIPADGLGMVSRWIASTTEMVELLRKVGA